jgi:hypothetical protein
MYLRNATVGCLLAIGLSCVFAGDAPAAEARPLWRHRENYRAPAAAAAPTMQAGTRYSNRMPGRGGWNAENTWFTQAPYGNYAPPPYATSHAAFYQVGPVPAFGGVRSLPGWGGAR